jgi:hypothetical protein
LHPEFSGLERGHASRRAWGPDTPPAAGVKGKPVGAIMKLFCHFGRDFFTNRGRRAALNLYDIGIAVKNQNPIPVWFLLA